MYEAFFGGVSLLVSEGWSAIANTITKIYINFANVGIYALADKLSNIFSLISFSIFTVLLPKNAKLKRDQQEYDFKETIIKSWEKIAQLGPRLIIPGHDTPFSHPLFEATHL